MLFPRTLQSLQREFLGGSMGFWGFSRDFRINGQQTCPVVSFFCPNKTKQKLEACNSNKQKQTILNPSKLKFTIPKNNKKFSTFQNTKAILNKTRYIWHQKSPIAISSSQIYRTKQKLLNYQRNHQMVSWYSTVIQCNALKLFNFKVF